MFVGRFEEASTLDVKAGVMMPGERRTAIELKR